MSTLVLWHGAHRWEGPPQLRPAGKGKSEEGSGLYLTTSEQTASKYAKGGGAVLRFEIDSDLRLLEDAWLDTADVVAFVESIPRLRNKKQVLADIQRAAGRQPDPTKIPAYVVENLMVNHDALKGEAGPALARWFVSRGIDANVIRRSDEDWLVLYNLDKIQSYRRAKTDEVRDSPRIPRKNNPAQPRSRAEQIAARLIMGD